mmetsp:Transcript_25427/g.57783  ORF Transcript_25427/g.57783 Transcript_25427/m.57783 type:complete len:215 (+) Transcript_25427:644-1288(+)
MQTVGDEQLRGRPVHTRGLVGAVEGLHVPGQAHHQDQGWHRHRPAGGHAGAHQAEQVPGSHRAGGEALHTPPDRLPGHFRLHHRSPHEQALAGRRVAGGQEHHLRQALPQQAQENSPDPHRPLQQRRGDVLAGGCGGLRRPLQDVGARREPHARVAPEARLRARPELLPAPLQRCLPARNRRGRELVDRGSHGEGRGALGRRLVSGAGEAEKGR